MRSKYSVRAVSVVILLPLLFLPAVLTGQTAQQIPLKNWAAPLYWQPNNAEMAERAERESAMGITPKLQFSATQVSPSALTFIAVTPCRLVDTRGAAAGFNGLTPFSGPSLAPSGTVTFPVQSAAEATADTTPAPCGTIPFFAQAYSFNITVVPKTAGGVAFLTVWPSGSPQPAVSTLNDGEGVILANAAIVPAGTPNGDGGVSVFNSGPATTDVIIDMNGFYAASTDLNQNTGVGSGTLVSNTTGFANTAGGAGALESNTTGSNNTAIGASALQDNSTGIFNTASGVDALAFNTTGGHNTATGVSALTFNSTGSSNTASGYAALGENTTGNDNTASGMYALANNTTGTNNTAVGYQALQGTYPATGDDNTAAGYQALANNTAGTQNAAIGYLALQSNTTGGLNTASGANALLFNTTGSYNTATGSGALELNATGFNNVASGFAALENNTTGGWNTANGYVALGGNSTGSNNIAIGNYAASGVSGDSSNNIHIGSQGAAGDSGTIRIGTSVPSTGCPVCGPQTSFFVAGVSNVNLGSDPNGVAVLIDTTTGQLGVTSSSRRYKEDIKDMGEASRDLMRLRPVTFRYKKPFDDGSKPIQYGLIAEEVDEVYPDLVVHSADGQIETVKYQVLPAMLLNEVQKQNQRARQQDETIRQQHELVLHQQEQVLRQQQEIRALEARLSALEALLSAKSPTATSGR